MSRSLGKKTYGKSFYVLVMVETVIFAMVFWSLADVLKKKQTVNTEIASLEDEKTSLESSNESLKKLVEYMKTSAFVEAEAKSQLKMKHPEEQVIVITRSDTGAKDADSEDSSDVSAYEGGNPKRWLEYFFGS